MAFFGAMDENVAPQALGAEFTGGFIHAMWWVVGVLMAVFALMFALPRHSAAAAEPVVAEEPAEREAVLVP